MIRPVIGTVGARVLITLANVLLVALAGRQLGAAGLGTISLIVLGITFILIMAHMIGGGGLVYVVPRAGISAVLRPTYTWAILTGAVALVVVHLVPLVPQGFALHVVALAVLQAFNSIHLNIMVGRERIGSQNTLLVVQSIVQLIAFGILLQWNGAQVMDYVWASYLAFGSTVITSAFFIWNWRKEEQPKPGPGAFKALLKQGGIGQVANLFQLFNYRAAYYLIEAFRGTSALGVYSVATQLSEGAWLVPKSIGGVLYSKVSNLEEERRQVQLTLILFKVSILFGLLSAVLLLLLPDRLYTTVFGAEINGLRPIILYLAPGLMAMSGSQVLSHYFSGTGWIRHNLIGSGLGLVVTLVVGWSLIPVLGLDGAALTASLAYCTSLLYQLIVFMRRTAVPFVELLPHTGDIRKARSMWYIHRTKRSGGGSYL